MDKVKHEIEAALAWLEEGNVDRVKLHLGFALRWRDDESQPTKRAVDLAVCTCSTRAAANMLIIDKQCPVHSPNH